MISSYIDSIDRAAEREGDALERLAELTGYEQPQSQLERRREAPPVREYRYSREGNVKAWLKILRAHEGSRVCIRVNRRLCEWTTNEDRERQAAQRRARRALLRRVLKRAAKDPTPVDYQAAARTLGMPIDTFCKVLRRFRFESVTDGRRRYFTRRGLAAYASHELAKAA